MANKKENASSPGFRGARGFSSGGFLAAEIMAALVTVVSVDASATFAVVAFAILMETFSISVSMGSDIRIITRTTTRITIHTLIKTTMRIGAWTILETFECLDQVT